MGDGVQAAYDCIRSAVPYQPGDALWGPEIEAVKGLVLDGALALKYF